MEYAIVIGGGLAGCEAAWMLANQGIGVHLYDMKPVKFTPAHSYAGLGELVCSNSLRAAAVSNAAGLLKEEMRRLGSLVMQCADETSLPAGGALAVDREKFSDKMTAAIKNHPNITYIEEELTQIPEGNVIVATGPLTAQALSQDIAKLTGGQNFYFYDAAAPIVTRESIDMDLAFYASRYDKGDKDYINCPMDKEKYDAFYNALITAECAPIGETDKQVVFEGCMPIETMASRGEQTMRFGPLKPVGLVDPKTGKEPYAVVQLRQDNLEGTLYNIVGFQTHLKWGEQKRVFGMIPGLGKAEIVRFGVMHRNSFINSPKLLTGTYQFRERDNLYFAGQMTGVEGYIESASSGMVAGLNLGRKLQGKAEIVFGNETAIGALAQYVSGGATGNFQPMNITFGLIKPLEIRVRKKAEKNQMLAERALGEMERYGQEIKK